MYWTVFLQNAENINSVKKILSELKSDNATKINTCLLIEELKLSLPKSDEDIRWSLHRLGTKLFEDYIKISKSDRKNADILEEINDIDKRYKKIIEENHAFDISMLDITGKDLMDLGIPKGPKIGEILEELLKRVIEEPKLNNKELLVDIAKKK